MSRKRMSWSEYMKLKEMRREAYRKEAQMSVEHADKIRQSRVTSIMKYPEQKKAYDYVHALFPKYGIKEVEILKTSQPILKRLGYGEAGGFFNRVLQVVVIPESIEPKVKKDDPWSQVTAKVTFDEVLVHELLHYASSCQNKSVSSMELEEEFAYGRSIGYLKSKGHTDDEIIQNNFMPFLVGTIRAVDAANHVLQSKGYDVSAVSRLGDDKRKAIIKRHEHEICDEMKRRAFAKGKELIRIYGEEADCNERHMPVDGGDKKYDMLDL